MGDGGTTNREPRSLGYHLGFLIKLEDVRWSGRSERTQSRPAARNPTRRMEKMKHPTWTSKERFKPVGGLRPPRVSLAATVWETTRLGHLHTCAGKWMARKRAVWGRWGDGIWETDLTSSRRSTWPCCQAPLLHGPWAPTAPTRLISNTQKLRTPLRSATQLDQQRVTGAADCRALDRSLKGTFLSLFPLLFNAINPPPGIVSCSVHPPHMLSSS